jgi:CRISPR-associated exonuclease Cas4
MSAQVICDSVTQDRRIELLPLSLLNDFLFCNRRAALKIIEGWRAANEHTARGDIVHEHADLPGYEVAKGVTLLRALPVWSERLGLNGKCDIVEAVFHLGKSKFEAANLKSISPVEYKRGKRKQWDNDDAQLCAQAICLEEMLQIEVPRGAIFHAESKRRREVEFTAELRAATERTAAQLHELLAGGQIPAAIFKPACEECSLFQICLPRATGSGNRGAQLSRRLFEI